MLIFGFNDNEVLHIEHFANLESRGSGVVQNCWRGNYSLAVYFMWNTPFLPNKFLFWTTQFIVCLRAGKAQT